MLDEVGSRGEEGEKLEIFEGMARVGRRKERE
jgi:hypothetical protein